MLKRKYRIRIIEFVNAIYFISTILLFGAVCGGYECNNYDFIGFVARAIIAVIVFFLLHIVVQYVTYKLRSH